MTGIEGSAFLARGRLNATASGRPSAAPTAIQTSSPADPPRPSSIRLIHDWWTPIRSATWDWLKPDSTRLVRTARPRLAAMALVRHVTSRSVSVGRRRVAGSDRSWVMPQSLTSGTSPTITGRRHVQGRRRERDPGRIGPQCARSGGRRPGDKTGGNIGRPTGPSAARLGRPTGPSAARLGRATGPSAVRHRRPTGPSGAGHSPSMVRQATGTPRIQTAGPREPAVVRLPGCG